jgi:hypothetical protein
MAVGIDQTRHQDLFAEVENFAGLGLPDFGEPAHIRDQVAGHRDRTIVDRLASHRHDGAGSDNHRSA